MQTQVEEIKNKIDIVNFIGQYVEVKKAGRNFKANCPFHQEKTPSFVISPDRQIWRCFGTCGEGGDVISFLMKMDNLTFYEALKELADRVGIKLESVQYDDKEWSRKELLYQINHAAQKFYSFLLSSEKYGKIAHDYVINRGLNPKIVNTFELGYAPHSWNSLLNYLLKKGFQKQDIVATGLAIMNDQGRVYDRFRSRLMFPLKDHRGNVIGFSGRLLGDSQKEAKYVNTPETEIYHKRETLYGIHLTKESIRKNQNAYVVEGEFDVITPYQHGVDNVVAIKGAAFTKDQLMLLGRYTKRITLALDGDEAGIEAMKRGIRTAEALDFEVYVAMFQDGKDPDEAIKHDFGQFKKDIKSSVPIYDFLIQNLQRKYPEQTAFQKKKIGEELVPFIRDIENPIVQSHYTKVVADMLDVSEGSMYRAMRGGAQLKARAKPEDSKKIEKHFSRSELVQRFFLAYLLQQQTLDETLAKSLDDLLSRDFTIPSFGHLFDAYRTEIQKHTPFSYAAFVPTLSSELQSVADELFLFVSALSPDEQPNIVKMAYEIKSNSLQVQINALMESSNEEDEKRLTQLSQEYTKYRKLRDA